MQKDEFALSYSWTTTLVSVEFLRIYTSITADNICTRRRFSQVRRVGLEAYRTKASRSALKQSELKKQHFTLNFQNNCSGSSERWFRSFSLFTRMEFTIHSWRWGGGGKFHLVLNFKTSIQHQFHFCIITIHSWHQFYPPFHCASSVRLHERSWDHEVHFLTCQKKAKEENHFHFLFTVVRFIVIGLGSDFASPLHLQNFSRCWQQLTINQLNKYQVQGPDSQLI